MQEGETGMKNKKAENAITAVLVAAVLVTGGMSLHSYLSEQRAKNEYDAIRQEVVAEPAAGETQEEIAEMKDVSQNTISKKLRRIKKQLTEMCGNAV